MATTGELAELREPIARLDAFRWLADRHLASSYRLAGAILHDAVEAEDATHDAFVTAWRQWHTLRDPHRFEAWFDRILINTCRNRLRRNRRWFGSAVHDVSAGMAHLGTDDMRTAEDRDELSRAILRLNADQRIVVALRYYRDLTVEQIADRTGAPLGTVKSRLHYALHALGGTLAASGDREGSQ